MTTPILPARTFSVSIKHEWRALYERIWQPEFFPEWAAGLSESHLRKDGEDWLADGADGTIRIHFTLHNDFGVMDHWVHVGETVVHVPLRVVANGDGAEVMLTLYRQPGMSEDDYSSDIKLVSRDLKTLKALIEKQGGIER